MKCLILGSGGREHAIGWSLHKDPGVSKLYFGPGNGGTSLIGENLPDINPMNFDSVHEAILSNEIDFVICGPEDPLVAGIYDFLLEKKVKAIGPQSSGAKLEGSKIFSKEFQFNMGIPTADYKAFTDPQKALDHLNDIDFKPVIKCDGLCAGKGVLLPETKDDAKRIITEILVDGKFKDAGNKIIIEERLDGFETTLLTFVDGDTILPMLFSQDYKRAFDNNEGLNTGGMGCLCPSPRIDNDLKDEIIQKFVTPTAKGLKEYSIPYKGILYFGLMITESGPCILEYNIRMGDPETQVVLPLLKTNPSEIYNAIRGGTLDKINLEWHDGAAVGVVLASNGYPESYEKGVPINYIKQWDKPEENFIVFHAGTKRENNNLTTSGGRVVCLTALGENLKECRNKIYSRLNKINTEGLFYRTDIAAEYI
ncbi:MAG: phosphoribosylamine--glycine ligase [bacterium]